MIIRTEKDKNYTVINNTIFRDCTISAKAKGLFAYIMSLPDDWVIYQSEIVKHFKENRSAISTAFKELESNGYLTKTKVRDDQGRFTHYDYTVYEVPKADYPKSDKPKSDNQQLLSTDNNQVLTKTKEPPKYNKMGEYENVYLTDKEIEKLKNNFDKKTINRNIRNLSFWVEGKEKIKTGTYARLLNFIKRDFENK